LIEGIYRLLLSDEHLPVNLGNTDEKTILELAEIINSIFENNSGLTILPGKRGEGDPQRRRPDISRAQKILNWKPTIGLEDGLKKTIPYFQENV
jgi:dTDP-glucose 4,6-dehydratase